MYNLPEESSLSWQVLLKQGQDLQFFALEKTSPSESLAHVVSGIIRLGVLSVARIHAARYAKILTRGIHIAPAHHYNAHQIIPFSVAVCHRVQYGLRAVYISSVYAIAHILIFRVGAV